MNSHVNWDLNLTLIPNDSGSPFGFAYCEDDEGPTLTQMAPSAADPEPTQISHDDELEELDAWNWFVPLQYSSLI